MDGKNHSTKTNGRSQEIEKKVRHTVLAAASKAKTVECGERMGRGWMDLERDDADDDDATPVWTSVCGVPSGKRTLKPKKIRR